MLDDLSESYPALEDEVDVLRDAMLDATLMDDEMDTEIPMDDEMEEEIPEELLDEGDMGGEAPMLPEEEEDEEFAFPG